MNNKSDSIVYVYAKEGKIETLDLGASEKAHKKLLKDGWVHTCTINACVFLERLYNESQDVAKEIMDLGKRSE